MDHQRKGIGTNFIISLHTAPSLSPCLYVCLTADVFSPLYTLVPQLMPPPLLLIIRIHLILTLIIPMPRRPRALLPSLHLLPLPPQLRHDLLPLPHNRLILAPPFVGEEVVLDPLRVRRPLDDAPIAAAHAPGARRAGQRVRVDVDKGVRAPQGLGLAVEAGGRVAGEARDGEHDGDDARVGGANVEREAFEVADVALHEAGEADVVDLSRGCEAVLHSLNHRRVLLTRLGRHPAQQIRLRRNSLLNLPPQLIQRHAFQIPLPLLALPPRLLQPLPITALKRRL